MFIRRDLTQAQQIIQASHASFLSGQKYFSEENPSIVLIAVDNKQNLEKLFYDFFLDQLEPVAFFESYKKIGMTSFAILSDKKEKFKEFALY